MKSIILASNNKDKVKEVKEILKGYDIISMKEAGIDVDIEENGTTFEENASYDIKNKALIQKLEGVKGSDRSGRFVCAIAVCFPDGREIVKRGTMEGLIAEEIKGDNGFGYDPIVYLPEYGRTSGELAPEEKNKISHRGKALALIKEELDKSEELYAEDNDSK